MGWEIRSTLDHTSRTAKVHWAKEDDQVPRLKIDLGSGFVNAAYATIRAASEIPDDAGSDPGGDTGTATITKPKSQTKTPPLYRVILMNDDFTPMDFVIHVIQKFFGKDLEEATQIMLQVHYKGAGICGVFSHEIAETKTHQVNQYSRQNRHPLKCTMEKA